jgi:hypothetical protein
VCIELPSAREIWDALNNASVGALIGAAAAYFLIAANDWRRNGRMAKKLLPAMLSRLLVLIDSRLNGVMTARATVDQQDQPMGNIGMPLPVDRIDRYGEQLADRLTDPQAFALENLAFWMREADRLSSEAMAIVRQIREAKLDPTRGDGNAILKVSGFKILLKQILDEERQLLEQTRDAIKAFLEGRLNERGGPPKSGPKQGE